MHRFINLFLIFFLIDGGISLVDELLRLTELGSITGLRNWVAFAVMLISIPVYLLLGIDRRLPKRILIPLVLLVFWGALGMWPLKNMVPDGMAGVCASVIQLVTAGLAFMAVRNRTGKSVWLTREMLAAPFFSFGNTALFTVASIVLVPAVLLFLGIGGAASYLEKETAGFMRLGLDGIYMTEKHYSADDKTVRLAGMIHIGKREYYHELGASVLPGKSVILLEGVSDQNRLLPGGLNHNRLASLSGLSSQKELVFPGRPIETGDMGVFLDEEDQASCVHIVRADVDTSDFDPGTIRFLNMIGKEVIASDSLPEAFNAYHLWLQEDFTDEVMMTIKADILENRNQVLVRHLETALLAYDTIVVPWGAMHMPHVEKWLAKRGFQQGDSIERLSLDFRSLDIMGLLKKAVAENGIHERQ